MTSRYFLVVVLMPRWFLCPGEYGSNYSTFLIARVVVCDNFVPQRALSQGFIEINKLSM